MNGEDSVKIDAINEQLLAFKLSEIDKAAFTNLLTRLGQKCFQDCIDSLMNPKLTSVEKECLNTCFNRRGVAREKVIQTILEDANPK
jgi:hypothetical protein